MIIFADDHELIREAIRPYLLQLVTQDELKEASNYQEVLDLCRACKAAGSKLTLILLDLSMPGINPNNPFLGLRQVQEEAPGVPVVIFSANENTAVISGAIQNGAQGYIPKTIRGRSLLNTLRLILSGEVYIPPSMAAASAHKDLSAPIRSIGADLSPRELESLRMLVKGMSNKEIARVLGVQGVTVKLHLRNAYRKIGATNRVDAVRIAVEHHLN